MKFRALVKPKDSLPWSSLPLDCVVSILKLRSQSYAIFCRNAGIIVTSISRDCNAFIFSVREFKHATQMDCLALKTKVLWQTYFIMSRTTTKHSVTYHLKV